ncbi:MAG TPA: hypothetical protein VK686_25790 [Bryobacteraceae bacterium]|jgi:hypothetical protein|nr:hypothetical protein [Bryobacteraceae bacterium]
MKTLVSLFIAGALSTTGAFAGAAGTSPNVTANENTIATPHVPFRPLSKRPGGARQTEETPKVNVATPQLPFRHYQKQPLAAPSNKPNSIEATKR